MPSVGEDWFIRMSDKDTSAGLTRVRILDYHGNRVWTLQGHQNSYIVPSTWDCVEGTDFYFVHPISDPKKQQSGKKDG